MEKGAYTKDSYSVLSSLAGWCFEIKTNHKSHGFFLNDMTGRFNLKVFSEHFKNTFSIYKLIF